MPEHSFFTHLADNFEPSKGKRYPHIDYSVVGANASVAQGFAATGEAVAVRVAAGLGLSMLQGSTTIR